LLEPRESKTTLEPLATNLKWLVGALFIAAMIMLIGGLVSFLREVYLATHTLRIGPPEDKR